MDPRHLKLYNEELHFIREMGKIFARNHPKVAGHLDLARGDCQDPYVERLLEGFAFLTSRIQLQYEEDFPEFSQHLLDIIYPDFLAPLPSMTVVQFNPEAELQDQGFELPRKTRLLSPRISEKKVQCEFQTTQDLKLWPLHIKDASYERQGNLHKKIKTALHPDIWKNTKSAIKLTLSSTNAQVKLNTLRTLDELPIYISGAGNKAGKIYETVIRNLHGIVLLSPDRKTVTTLNTEALTSTGYCHNTALLPESPQSFQGYRLLQEYFALPERFFFITLSNLQQALTSFDSKSVDIYFLLDSFDEGLLATLNSTNFKLFCTPVINLFTKDSDAVHLTKQPVKNRKNKEVTHYLPGHPITIDKGNPQHFEIYKILEVKGVTNYTQKDPIFSPFYSLNHHTINLESQYFYTLKRKKEIRESSSLSNKYKGNEFYISITDNTTKQNHSNEIKELRIKSLCTNRGLPLYLGNTTVNFTTPEESLPVKTVGGIQNIESFSTPKPAHEASEHTWKLINLLSLNHLSIANSNTKKNTQVLQELLQLQIHTQRVGDSTHTLQANQLQIAKGIDRVETRSIIHPLLIEGKMTYARGIQITITLEEEAFEGRSAFLFGSVLNHFFAQYVSINSFTQTVIHTLERGEIMKWPIQMGTQKIL